MQHACGSEAAGKVHGSFAAKDAAQDDNFCWFNEKPACGMHRERGLNRCYSERSEVQLQTELNFSRVMGRLDLTEVAAGHARGDRVPLRVVECIEELRAEFQPAATRLAEKEALEE